MRSWDCGDAARENLASLQINLLYRGRTRWRPQRNFRTPQKHWDITRRENFGARLGTLRPRATVGRTVNRCIASTLS